MPQRTATPDLAAYFRRIGYSGGVEPSLETLRGLHHCHAESVAFENLNPLLGWPVKLDLASLEQKLVRDGRGGYCYEQNGLFAHMLRALGFRVTGLAARVLWNQPDDAVTARSHMVLHVEIAGVDYIADVGFGGMTLTEPLRLECQIEQSTSHEAFRLMRLDDGFKLQVRPVDAWKSLYRFELVPQLPIDYEVSNYYVSTHPASHFVQNLMVAKTSAGHRYALLNNEHAIHDRVGGIQRRLLGSAKELRDALEQQFRIRLPETNALMPLLDRFANGHGREAV